MNIRIGLSCLAACLVGIVFFAYQQELIILQPYGWQQHALSAQATTIAYTLWLQTPTGCKHEQERCINPQNKHELLYHLIQRWLHFAYREGALNKKVHVQNCVLAHDTTDLFVSFDRNPFPSESSTHERMLLIKSLLKTIAQQPIVTHVYLLVQHAPLEDPYIDHTIAWPVSLGA